MSDLISRDYVLAEYDRRHNGPPGGARKIMEQAPAVDAAPVVHGKWIEVGTDIVCINCKAAYDADVANLYRGEQDLKHYRGFEHCPHCGAKMDGERRDNE